MARRLPASLGEPGEGPAGPSAGAPALVWPGKARAGALLNPASEARTLERWPAAGEFKGGWRNRLYRGDNLAALQVLLDELAGQVALVYLDPPFATGAGYRFQAAEGAEARSWGQGPRGQAFDDRWGADRCAFFDMLYPRLLLVRELLAEHGTLYLHLDWTVGHHVRPLLDEVFGAANSLGEIVWAYGSPSGGRAAGKRLVKAHDTLYVFARRQGRQRHHRLYLPYSPRYLERWFRFEDEDGRRYRKRWRRDAQGRTFVERQYLDESPGVPASSVWTDIQQLYADPRAYKAGAGSELTGFPTQKPLRLLERIVALSSDPGDLVADVFSGSGTTLEAAERLGRRWIGCDLGTFAVQATRKRLLELPSRAGFDVVAVAPRPRRGADWERRALAAYGARPLPQAGMGLRGDVLVRVLPPRAPLVREAVEEALEEARRSGARALHLLAREWRVEERALAALERARLPVRPLSLPAELPAALEGLSQVAVARARLVRTAEGVRVRVEGSWGGNGPKVGTEALDLWAVDWDYRGGPFQSRWWAGRTRRRRSLPLVSPALPPQARAVAVLAVDPAGEEAVLLLGDASAAATTGLGKGRKYETPGAEAPGV